MNNKALRNMDLTELDILLRNARATVDKLQRLMGGNTSSAEGKEFFEFGSLYRELEDEMNERIIRAVYQASEPEIN